MITLTVEQFLNHVAGVIASQHPNQHVSVYKNTQKGYMRLQLRGCDYLEVKPTGAPTYKVKAGEPRYKFTFSKYWDKKDLFLQYVLDTVKSEKEKFEFSDFFNEKEKECQWHDEEGNVVDPELNPADAVAYY